MSGADDDERCLDAVIVEPGFAAREGAPVVAHVDEIGVAVNLLLLELFTQEAGIMIGAAHLVVVVGEILTRLGAIDEVGRHHDILRVVGGRVVVEAPAAMGIT